MKHFLLALVVVLVLYSLFGMATLGSISFKLLLADDELRLVSKDILLYRLDRFLLTFSETQNEYVQQNVEDLVKSENVIVMLSTMDEIALRRLRETVEMIRTNGDYQGDIVILTPGSDHFLYSISSALDPANRRKVYFKVVPSLEGKVHLLPTWYSRQKPNTKSWVYLEKFFVYDLFFLNWKKVLYIDSGMRIWNHLQHVFELSEPGILMAHSDGFPSYERKLIDACSCDEYPAQCSELTKYFRNDLSIDFFQSTFLLFEPESVVTFETVNHLFSLVDGFNFLEGDQTYMALYFHFIQKKWKQIPFQTKDQRLWVYDFWTRDNRSIHDYIMFKYYHRGQMGCDSLNC